MDPSKNNTSDAGSTGSEDAAKIQESLDKFRTDCINTNRKPSLIGFAKLFNLKEFDEIVKLYQEVTTEAAKVDDEFSKQMEAANSGSTRKRLQQHMVTLTSEELHETSLKKR
jgi:hypothetical protein